MLHMYNYYFPLMPPSCPPPRVTITTAVVPPPAATRHRLPHILLVSSRFPPKKVPFEDTTEAVVVLAVGR